MPGPLPRRLALDHQTALRLTEAERLLARLAGIRTSLPKPDLPTRLFVRREAVLSSRLDGLRVSCSDLARFEAAPSTVGRANDVRQVANHVRALEHGLGAGRRQPVSLRSIRELHRILMRGARSKHVTPGEFRKTRTPITPPGCIDSTGLLPAPVREMRAAMEALERHLRKPSALPPLVRIALVHYQFETIHPFLDGNDRVGRMLIRLLLRTWGLLPSPCLCLSAYFERHRQEYYDRLVAPSEADGWERWIEFFLTGVAEQARDGVRRAVKVRRIRDLYLARLRRAPSRALLIDLVEGLFDRPAVSATGVAGRLKVTRRAAAIHLGRLADAGILSAAADGGRDVVFLARDIIRSIEDDLEPEAADFS